MASIHVNGVCILTAAPSLAIRATNQTTVHSASPATELPDSHATIKREITATPTDFQYEYSSGQATTKHVIIGAERTDKYLPILHGKRVGILTNHTGLIGGTHIVDSLLSLGIDIRCVFAPEHGFRGTADAGAKVDGYKDPRTGIDVISIYGANKRPKDSDINKLDIVVFDIQDVGLRFYTYISSMHYMMEACAANGIEMVVLDRPNPNGQIVDGPVLDIKYRSFVGMHPIPVLHGMTVGELARMINGEGWLTGGMKCKLTVIPCSNYTHRTLYELPVAPSPNLPNMRAIYLYASLCLFEGTAVSLGRGTDFPFQAYGHPSMKGHSFSFTPRSRTGAANPPLKDRKCFGTNLRVMPHDTIIRQNGLNLEYIIDAYNSMPRSIPFFNTFFEKLAGVDYIRKMITDGASAEEIKAAWADDVAKFKSQRQKYLLYEE